MELSDAINQLRSRIECAVCLETLSVPKLLSCGHRFCKKCIPKPDLSFHPAGHRSVTCPVCRSVGIYPNIDQLPNDSLANDIRDDIQRFEGILESDRFCMVCLNVIATKRCLSCHISLCEGCNLDHSDILLRKNHAVVRQDPSLFCETHGKDLSYACRDCHKLVCSCCIVGCCKGHSYVTVREAIDEYFIIKERTEESTQYVKDNYNTLKGRMQSTFNTVCTGVQKHSDDVIEAIQKGTEQMIEYLKKMESDALAILEATEAAADGLKDFTEVRREDCRFELPIELLKSLPEMLRSGLRSSKDSCILESIVFEPNKNVSIGSVRVRLSDPDDGGFMYCTSPRLYGKQQVGARCINRESDCGYDGLDFILDPCGQVFTIKDMWSLHHLHQSTDDLSCAW